MQPLTHYVLFQQKITPIGIGNDLHLISYGRLYNANSRGQLRQVAGSLPPSEYLRPESGFRFRFPFPDEDALPLGDIGTNASERKVNVTINPGENYPNYPTETPYSSKVTLTILHQLLVKSANRAMLATVLSNPHTNEQWYEEDDQRIMYLVDQIHRHHAGTTYDPQKIMFWYKVADRIRFRFFKYQ